MAQVKHMTAAFFWQTKRFKCLGHLTANLLRLCKQNGRVEVSLQGNTVTNPRARVTEVDCLVDPHRIAA